MKWTYTISNKLRAALALGTVVLLVISTNRIDNKKFQQIQDSFNSVYQDRLIAEKYLFELSRQLQARKNIVLTQDFNNENVQIVNDSIEVLIEQYEATKFTEEEAERFEKLKGVINNQTAIHKRFLTHNDSASYSQYISSFVESWNLLDELSQIQLKEANSLLDDTNKIKSSRQISSWLELSLLIVLGLILQALVFSSRPLKGLVNQKSHLN